MTKTRKSSKKSCTPFKLCTGSKLQVMRGTAEKTRGGVKVDGLTYNKRGRIVFKSKQAAADRNNNLFKSSKITVRKGEFGAIVDGKNAVTKK